MDKAQLLREIREERELLERAIGRIGAAAMVEPGVVGQWSVKDVLAHVVFWEETFRGWMEKSARGEAIEMPAPGLTWEEVDVLNERTYQENRDRPLADVRDAFAASYPVTLALVEAIDEGVLLDPERNPLGPRESLWRYATANTSEHYREHREALEAWLAARG